MFTWVPLYKEAAEKLRSFRDRQSELIGLLVRMREAEHSPGRRLPVQNWTIQ